MRSRLVNSKKGDVIKYKHPTYGLAYLVVDKVENGVVNGDIATSRNVNSISIDDLIKANAEIPIGWKSNKDPEGNSGGA